MRVRRLLLAASVAGTLASLPLSVRATIEVPVDAGAVVVVDANNRNREITEGDSNSVFSVSVPAGATCPGDSANDDWRVQSFVIPEDLDPGELEYGALRPIGENLHALYGADTRPYIQAFLAQNGGPGEPGQILEAPPLSFAVFPAGMLPPGVYRIGVACTYFRDTAKFWDTEIELIADTSVQPGEFRWRVVESADGVALDEPTNDGAGSYTVWLLLGGVGVAAAVVLVLRSRASSRTPIKEKT